MIVGIGMARNRTECVVDGKVYKKFDKNIDTNE